ncbi:MAG: trypsin, partial [Anaerolineae bacterium]|nr:trypsin [Anaerolineae bacterium]
MLYEMVNPGIVNILVFDLEGINLQSGQGSGFVIDKQGHIV